MHLTTPTPSPSPFLVEMASDPSDFDWSVLSNGLLPLVGVLLGGLITYFITSNSEKKKAEYDQAHKWQDEIQRLSVEMIESSLQLRRAMELIKVLDEAEDVPPGISIDHERYLENQKKREAVSAISTLHSALMIVAPPILYVTMAELVEAGLNNANAMNEDRDDMAHHHVAAITNFANKVRFVLGVDPKLGHKEVWVPDPDEASTSGTLHSA